MRKNIYLIFIVSIILNSCATYVKVNMMMPAEIGLGDLKNLAVIDDEFVGNWTFDRKDEPETITEIIKEGLKQSLDIPLENNVKPDPINAFPIKNVSTKLIAKLVENGHYNILERDMLDRILGEQKLSMSGIVSGNNTLQIGELLGVECLMIVGGNYSVDDDGGWYQRKNKDGVVYKFYRINRKVNVSITYKVVSIETGEILASKENSSKRTKYVDRKDEKTALEQIPEWKPIVNKLVDKIIKKSIKQIAPYYKKTSKMIKSGKSIGMKTGLQYAKRNLWEDAKESWEQVLDDASPNSINDRILAMYNLGVYHEINDELDKAKEIFDNCYKQSGKNEYLDARLRIEKRKKELEKLKEQEVDNPS